MQPSVIASIIALRVAELLVPVGFRRRSRLFSRPRNDLVHLIQIQSSQANSQQASSCTVNLGIWVPMLEPDSAPNIAGAHWRERLGSVCPERQDKWWRADDAASAELRANEIFASLRDYGLPALEELPDVASVLRLWSTGTCPGLTGVQAVRYAGKLRGAVLQP